MNQDVSPTADGSRQDRLLDMKELSKLLGGISRASIYRHMNSLPGFPQPVKIGASTRFRHSEVQAFIRGDCGETAGTCSDKDAHGCDGISVTGRPKNAKSTP